MRTRSRARRSRFWSICGETSGSGETSFSRPRENSWLAQMHRRPGPPALFPPPAPPQVPVAPSTASADVTSWGNASVWLTDTIIMSFSPRPPGRTSSAGSSSSGGRRARAPLRAVKSQNSASGCSCIRSPTGSRATTPSGPMPDRSRIAGEWIAPAHRTTPCARTSTHSPPRRARTPVARPDSTSTLSTVAPPKTRRF